MTEVSSLNVKQILEFSSKLWFHLLCLFVRVPWVASCFVFGRCWTQISACRPIKLTEGLYGFPQVLHEIQWGKLQRTVFVKIRILKQTQMLQQTQKNTIGRRRTRVRMTCRAFPLWLERQSSSLLWFVRFSYQFSLVTCLFVQCLKVK
jgi:hypothetical protein